MNSLHERILHLAEFTAETYKNDISSKSLDIIHDVIADFRSYFETGSADYLHLCDIVQGKDGIWNYATDASLSEKEQEMWELEANGLLLCILRMEMTAHDDRGGEDMAIVEENIPDYVDYMENHFKSSEDYLACVRYWNENLCQE